MFSFFVFGKEKSMYTCLLSILSPFHSPTSCFLFFSTPTLIFAIMLYCMYFLKSPLKCPGISQRTMYVWYMISKMVPCLFLFFFFYKKNTPGQNCRQNFLANATALHQYLQSTVWSYPCSLTMWLDDLFRRLTTHMMEWSSSFHCSRDPAK